MNTSNSSVNFPICLLVPVSDASLSDKPNIELFGKLWTLVEYVSSEAPKYTCLSYSWGVGREENPLHKGQYISDRTIPALEAVIETAQTRQSWDNVVMYRDPQKNNVAITEAIEATQAFWIDALCVPQQEPTRTNCLENMGAIYNAAWQVFAVLSATSSTVFTQIRGTNTLDAAALFSLEDDEWISRAWTYQEAVNSQAMYLIVQEKNSMILSGLDFLNAVLTATDDYRTKYGIDASSWAAHHPTIQNLECLVADYRIAEYGERSAYQVMSSMHPRIAERIEDYFYAMVGAITTTPQSALNDPSISPSEFFMRVCEAKGDFSFIYNTAPRSDLPGKKWRPVEGKFPPIQPGVFASGKGLTGRLVSGYLQLENMHQFTPAPISLTGLKAASTLIERDVTNLSPEALASAILSLLRKSGFSGCGEYLEFEHGFFFPQSTITDLNNLCLAITPDVQWVGGCPGLLLRQNDSNINDFCDVGVYIGWRPQTKGSTINLK